MKETVDTHSNQQCKEKLEQGIPDELYPFIIITFATVHDHHHTKDNDKMIDHEDPILPAFRIGIIQDLKYDVEYDTQTGQNKTEELKSMTG